MQRREAKWKGAPGRGYMLYDADRLDQPSATLFQPDWWRQQDAVTGEADGRGTAWFLRYGEQDWVLRHFRRGGMVGKLVEDRYLWLGLSRSRPWLEFKLLERLVEMGLPVCKPVAAHVHRVGTRYRGDLITELIPDTTSLTEKLVAGPLPEPLWRRLGETLARFHNAGVYHADLNANNILFDAGDAIWLIDFDRGHIDEPDERCQTANLERLQRSLNKLAGAQPVFHYDTAGWQLMVGAYLEALGE